MLKNEVAPFEETIVKITFHNSYATVRSYVPVYTKEVQKVYHFRSLPFSYIKETEQYMMKNIPQTLVINSGFQQNTTKCRMDLLEYSSDLMACGNIPQHLDHINLILDLGMYKIYLIKKIGTVSMICPNAKMQFFKMKEELNVFLVHSSCFVTIKDEYFSLKITQQTDEVPKGIQGIHLLQYTLAKSWTWYPSVEQSWIIQICTVGIIVLLAILIIAGAIWWHKKKSSINEIVEAVTSKNATSSMKVLTRMTKLEEPKKWKMSTSQTKISEEDNVELQEQAVILPKEFTACTLKRPSFFKGGQMQRQEEIN